MKLENINLLTPLARKIGGDRVSVPHIMAFLQYNSFRKMSNLARLLWEKKKCRDELVGLPFILFLEVNNICNLHCPFCLTGKGKKGERPKRNMTLREMKGVVEPLAEVLYFIQLYNWGEPLMNKDLFKLAEYAHRKKIFTMVSSNMNFSSSTIPQDIIDSGIDYFIAAIDGFSAETYSKYRRGGDFNKAIKNLQTITELKKKQGSKTPYIEWQYVVFRHNQHEIQAAKMFAEDIGVDYFHPIKGYVEDPEWITTLEEYRSDLGSPESVTDCARPWTHFNVRVDGGVASCCYEYYKKDDFGNVFTTPFNEVWNNDMFKASRQVIAHGVGTSTSKKTICHKCIATGKRPSFEENI